MAISSVVAPWAGFLNLGPIGADGVAALHLSFDRRFMDGAADADAMRALQAALQGPLLAERRSLAARGGLIQQGFFRRTSGATCFADGRGCGSRLLDRSRGVP